MAFGLDDALMLLGGAKTLFGGKQDPYADIRKQYKTLLAQIQTEFPRQRAALTFRGGQQQRDIYNLIGSRGAAAGLPENVVEQNMSRAWVDAGRNTDMALGGLEDRQNATRMNLLNATLNIPPKQVDTWGEDLLSTGIQMLLANKNPAGGEGGFDLLGWLKSLYSSGGIASGINGTPGLMLERAYTPTNRRGVRPGLSLNSAYDPHLIGATYRVD